MVTAVTTIVPQMPSRRFEKTQKPTNLTNLYKKCTKEFYFQFQFLDFFFNYFPSHRAGIVPVDLPKCLGPKGHRGVKNVTHVLDKFILQDMALKMKSKRNPSFL